MSDTAQQAAYREEPPANDPLHLTALEGLDPRVILTCLLIFTGIHCEVVYAYNQEGNWAKLTYMVGPTGTKMLLKDEPSSLAAPPGGLSS